MTRPNERSRHAAPVMRGAVAAPPGRVGPPQAAFDGPAPGGQAPGGAVQAKPMGARLLPAVTEGGGRVRVAAASAGRMVGSAAVHTGGIAARITGLGVDAPYRDRGIGAQLLASATEAGFRAGSHMLVLQAQDNGSGRLKVGVDGQGKPRLEIPVARLMERGQGR